MASADPPVNNAYLSRIEVVELLGCNDRKFGRMLERAGDGLYPFPPGREMVGGKLAYRNNPLALKKWFVTYSEVYPQPATA